MKRSDLSGRTRDLPRLEEVWEVIRLPQQLPNQRDDERPWLIVDEAQRPRALTVDGRDGLAGAAALLAAAEVDDGPVGLPRLVRAGPDDAALLEPALTACGVPVEVTEDLGLAAALLERLADLAPEESLAPMVGVASGVRELFAVGARVARLAPWDFLLDSDWLHVAGAPGPWPAPVVSVLGAGGEVYGAVIYPDRAAAERARVEAMTAAPGSRPTGAQILLSFDRAGDEVPEHVVAVMHELGLEIEGGLVPTVMYVEEGEPRDLSSDGEHELVLSVLEAVAAYLEAGPPGPPRAIDAGGRRMTLRAELSEVDNEGGLLVFHGSSELIYDPHQALVLPRSDVPPALMLKGNKRDAERWSRELAGVDALSFAAGVTEEDEPVFGVFAHEGDEYLGLLTLIAAEAYELLELSAGELDLVFSAGGARRPKVRHEDLLTGWPVEVIPAPLPEALGWEDDPFDVDPLDDDEGDPMRKLDLILGCALDPDNEQRAAALSTPQAGRNDPCPCGSGKKFKKCCGSPRARLKDPLHISSRLHALDHDVNRAIARHAVERLRPDEVVEYAAELPGSFGEAPEDMQLAVSCLLYTSAPAGVSLASRLAKEAPVTLDDRRRSWVARMSASPVSIYQVAAPPRPPYVRLRDMFREREYDVVDKGLSESVVEGYALLGRVVDADVAVLVGTHPNPLGAAQVDRAVAALRDELFDGTTAPVEDEVLLDPECTWALLDAWRETLVAAAAGARGARLTNTDGDALLWTTDVFAVEADVAAVRARLLTLDGAEDAGDEVVFTGVTEGPLPSSVIGHATFRGDRLEIETNSIARADALRARIEEAARGLLVHRARTHEDVDPRSPVNIGRETGDGGLSLEQLPPEARAQVEALMEQMSRAWVDEVVPALGDVTPRAAVRTPDGRRRVLALLDEMEAAQGAAPGMNAALIRRELGIDVDG